MIIASNNLIGRIPTELGSLTQMVELFLRKSGALHSIVAFVLLRVADIALFQYFIDRR